jgi:CDP-diacylglycerol--glycerol-3-phosphate 3-phosphatidyltransferase
VRSSRGSNQLTLARLVLAVVFFGVMNTYRYAGPDDPQTSVLCVALALFLIAAATDALDGFLARRWQAITLFGRVMDPVADKILILGAFIYLAGPRFAIPADLAADGSGQITGVYPWMAVVILFRELLITSMRAALESRGVDFSAVWSGKLKMMLQTATVPVVLVAVWLDPFEHAWARWTRDGFVWATVIATIASGVPYCFNAVKAVRDKS